MLFGLAFLRLARPYPHAQAWGSSGESADGRMSPPGVLDSAIKLGRVCLRSDFLTESSVAPISGGALEDALGNVSLRVSPLYQVVCSVLVDLPPPLS